MKNFFAAFTILILSSLFIPSNSFAQTDYVLPYPSAMPGSKLYRAYEVWDEVQKYWHFGDLSQFRYNLVQSDKHLVEAKTLFEYKQYLLGDEALKKSDNYFDQARIAVDRARENGKEISNEQKRLRAAAQKHKDVLLLVRDFVPKEFIWQPEKAASTRLQIQHSIDKAVLSREACL